MIQKLRYKTLKQVSYRRFLLNQKLDSFFSSFSADIVVDMGGTNAEGIKYYRFPKENFAKWITVNISEEAKPDVLGSIYETGLPDNCADVVVCTEVFEHLEHPLLAMKEILRILKSGGTFIGSTPFLFKIHGDPDDYFRYTESAIRKVFLSSFSTVEVYPMGGGLGTAGMMLTQVSDDFKYRLLKYFVIFIARMMVLADYKMGHERKDKVTTGYIWRCQL